MRKLLLWLSAVLLLVLVGAVHAQTVPVVCSGLDEADCAILTRASEQALTLDEASFDLDVIMNVEAPDEAITVDVDATGAYSGATAYMAMANPELMTDMSAQLDLLVEFLRSADAELNMTITLPDDSLPNGNKLDLNLVLLDGFGYVNFEALQPVINDPSLPAWGGLDLASLAEELLEQFAPLFEMQMGELGGVDADIIAQFSDPAFFEDVVTYTRLDSDDDNIAVFSADFDFAALFENEAFRELMMQQFEAQGMEFDEEEFDEIVAQSTAMLENLDFVYEQSINVETGYTTQLYFDMSMDGAAMGEPGTNVQITMTLSYSDFNDAPEITAPEDAEILPYEMLINMIMGSSDSSL